jgi:hypothetical protein
MYFIIKYDRKNGKVKDVKEYVDWDVAFKIHMDTITNETNPDISVSLIDAPDRKELERLYGAFFH